MRLALLTLWETSIYWNGDNTGSYKGANSVTVNPSTTLCVIKEGKTSVTVYSATA